MKIALAVAHFPGFGVARQGSWNTWVNRVVKLTTCRGLHGAPVAGLGPEPFHHVGPRYPALSVSRQVLEDGQCFAGEPQVDGLTVAEHLVVAKESDLQIGSVDYSVG